MKIKFLNFTASFAAVAASVLVVAAQAAAGVWSFDFEQPLWSAIRGAGKASSRAAR